MSRQQLPYLVRALALFLAGFVIAFTAPLHDVAFSAMLFIVTVLAIAILDLVTAVVAHAHPPSRTLALWRFLAAVLATVAILVSTSEEALAFVVTLWAAATALIEVWFGWASRTARDSKELLGSGIFAGLAAILLLVLPDDPVSVIGVFGGYCFVVATFIGIAAFDPSSPTSQRESTS